jgi:hypothetical protein
MSPSVPLLNLPRTPEVRVRPVGKIDQNEGDSGNRYNHCKITKVTEGLPMHAGLHANSPSLFSDFVQNWNMSTNLKNLTPEFKISWKSVQTFFSSFRKIAWHCQVQFSKRQVQTQLQYFKEVWRPCKFVFCNVWKKAKQSLLSYRQKQYKFNTSKQAMTNLSRVLFLDLTLNNLCSSYNQNTPAQLSDDTRSPRWHINWGILEYGGQISLGVLWYQLRPCT